MNDVILQDAFDVARRHLAEDGVEVVGQWPQKNVLDRRSWTTRQQLRIALVTWIERTYHRRRRQARLGR